MYFSKHNIFSKIKDSDSYYIVNLLTGNADILDPHKANEIISGNFTDVEEYQSKGYLADEKTEKKLYNEKYLDFIDTRDNDEIQIFFVPWYSCNFNCGYCYQSEYDNKFSLPTKEVIDSFFQYVNTEFGNKKKYITLFGGEPLLQGNKYKEIVKYFLEKADTADLDVAIVTNGYSLAEYMDILRTKRIREIQVTLDGAGEIHNQRRPLKGGDPTFHKIVEGIDQAIANNITVNLRVVIDKENIYGLVELSRFAIEKGWTKSSYFKTQLGRNYELHYCQSGNSKLLSRIEFYETIYKLIKQYPEIAEFHKPAFSVSKFLFENGELPSPLFDSCPGTKTEWAFDYTGRIYSCTATVGKSGSSLGTFYPEAYLNSGQVNDWDERDVTTINECKTCSLQLACGGGCAAVAFNKTGSLHSPDCHPIKESIGLGISMYFNKELV
ncbi:MAG: radical SAM protein [Ignavibacteriaceae bacterium]|nr:radical SAM protein [Ignavibacteriaceae bacterium]